MKQTRIIKGNFVYCSDEKEWIIEENSYGICIDGISKGIYKEVPEKYKDLPVEDFGNCLILPGLVDLHVHAPQYGYRGTGFDCELIEWLNTYTFPVESKFREDAYAENAYGIFVKDLQNSATTRAVIFGTIYENTTRILMGLLEASGLKTYVGKVNMDRNCPDYYREKDAETSILDTIHFIEESEKEFVRTKPILTPRFIPTCSDALMRKLGELKERYHVPLQSHLSENRGEIQWVKELCPWASCYGDAYKQSNTLEGKTIMAHCVSSSEEEIRLLQEKQVFVAHCPKSNLNIMSGIAPVRTYMEKGIPVGLGSDVAGGENLSLFEEMARAIQVSKMYWRYVDESCKPLSAKEALYLATKGGGAFFGKVGSFEEGYEFDAIVLDDGKLKSQLELTIAQRVERLIYNEKACEIKAKYTAGREIELLSKLEKTPTFIGGEL